MLEGDIEVSVDIAAMQIAVGQHSFSDAGRSAFRANDMRVATKPAAISVAVKIKYSDFTQATRSKTTALPFAGVGDIIGATNLLLAGAYPFKRPIRLLGVTLSSLTNDKDSENGTTAARPRFLSGRTWSKSKFESRNVPILYSRYRP